MSILDSNTIPIGLGMALSENLAALRAFAELDPETRHTFITRSQNIHSRDEMHQLTNELTHPKS